MSIQIKRGNLADLPALKDGELGFAKDAYEVYIGSDKGNVLLNNGEVKIKRSNGMIQYAYANRPNKWYDICSLEEIKGDQGIQGIQGIQGLKGDKGDNGEKGDKGERGLQGIQGIQGIQGLTGDKGDKGDKGDTPSIQPVVDEMNKKFNALTSQQQQEAEVITARDGEASLTDRLERDLKKGKQITETKQGSYIVFDNTVDSIIPEFELLGNTYQTMVNLADIKSSGKPNGDGTYDYELVSYGENICPGVELGYINNSTGEFIPSSETNRMSGIVRVNPNYTYTFTKNNAFRAVNKFYYDKNKKFLRMGNETNPTFTIPSDAYYLGLTFGTVEEKGDYMLKEFNGMSPYVPYQETRCVITLPCQLDILDRVYFDKVKNAWCVEKNMLDFKLSDMDILWSDYFEPTAQDVLFFWGNIPNIMDTDKGGMMFCNTVPFEHSLSNKEHCYIGGGSNIYIALYKTKCSSVSSFKTFIKNNNVVVKCKLIKPQIIELPQSEQVKLNSFTNRTYMICSSGDLSAVIKATVNKTLKSTVQTNTNSINALREQIHDIQTLKDSQDFEYNTDKKYITCDGTYNGVVKDLKLSGKTLINPWRFKSTWMPINTEVVATASVGTCVNKIKDDNGYFKPNDLVTIFANIYVDTPTNCYYQINYRTPTGEEKSLKNVSFYTGIKSFVITLPSDFDHFDSIFVGVSAGNTRVFKNNGCMCIKGNHLDNVLPYFEGIKHVGDGSDLSVSTVNTNLFDESVLNSRLEDDGYYHFRTTGNTRCSLFFGIVDSASKSVGVMSPNNTVDLSNIDLTGYKVLIGINGDVKDDKISFPIENFPIGNFNIFKNVGEVVMVDYNHMKVRKPYININKDLGYSKFKKDVNSILFKDTDNIWKPVTVLKGIDMLNRCDVIDSSTKTYTKCILEKVENGTGSWQVVDVPKTNTMLFLKMFTESEKCELLGNNSNILCDRFNNKYVYNLDEEGIFINRTTESSMGGVYIRINKSRLETQDVAGLLKWLQANNVTYIYKGANIQRYSINPIYPESYPEKTNVFFNTKNFAPYSYFKIVANITGVMNNVIDRVCDIEDNLFNITKAILSGDMKSLALYTYPNDFSKQEVIINGK